uniref:Ig-like domain-containing protein n=1 Tax=Salarias fasciatus TaxID=181472 RepID=A0A672I3W2_SALFA
LKILFVSVVIMFECMRLLLTNYKSLLFLPEIHSLKYFVTGASQVPNFPEYVEVGLVDELQITHYDSNTRRLVSKQDWMNKVAEEDPTYWEDESDVSLVDQQTFKADIETAKQRFNQTGGFHIFQKMYGCEWDDETDEVNGFHQYGYDGEDFLVLDVKTETWIAPVQQAVPTKHKWEIDKEDLAYKKYYLTQECPEWLKKYVEFGRSSLMRKDLPSVSLLQKTPSSPLTCHATGFYPDRADLFWKKDEEELHEDVVKGEILPNHDGSFQMSVDLDVSGLQDEDWGRYSCVFHLAGGQEVSKRLDKRDIRTNWKTNDGGQRLFISLSFSHFFSPLSSFSACFGFDSLNSYFLLTSFRDSVSEELI